MSQGWAPAFFVFPYRSPGRRCLVRKYLAKMEGTAKALHSASSS